MSRFFSRRINFILQLSSLWHQHSITHLHTLVISHLRWLKESYLQNSGHSDTPYFGWTTCSKVTCFPVVNKWNLGETWNHAKENIFVQTLRRCFHICRFFIHRSGSVHVPWTKHGLIGALQRQPVTSSSLSESCRASTVLSATSTGFRMAVLAKNIFLLVSSWS